MEQHTYNNQCGHPSQNNEPPTARTPLTLAVNHRVEVISQAVHYLVHPFSQKTALATIQSSLSLLKSEIRPSNENCFTNPYIRRYHRPCFAKSPSSPRPAHTLSLVVRCQLVLKQGSRFQALADSFSLLPLFWRLLSFVFKRLRTLFAKYRGWGWSASQARSNR